MCDDTSHRAHTEQSSVSPCVRFARRDYGEDYWECRRPPDDAVDGAVEGSDGAAAGGPEVTLSARREMRREEAAAAVQTSASAAFAAPPVVALPVVALPAEDDGSDDVPDEWDA